MEGLGYVPPPVFPAVGVGGLVLGGGALYNRNKRKREEVNNSRSNGIEPGLQKPSYEELYNYYDVARGLRRVLRHLPTSSTMVKIKK